MQQFFNSEVKLIPIQINVYSSTYSTRIFIFSNHELKIKSAKQCKTFPIKTHQSKWIQFNFKEPTKIITIKTLQSNIKTHFKVYQSLQKWRTSNPDDNINIIMDQTVTEIQNKPKFQANTHNKCDKMKQFVNILIEQKIKQRISLNYDIKNRKQLCKNFKINHPKSQNRFLQRKNNKRISLTRDYNTSIRANFGLKGKQKKSILKQSAFTRKSQRQTSIGIQKSILTKYEVHPQSTQTLDLGEQQYSRRLMKFNSYKIRDINTLNIHNTTEINFNNKNCISTNSISLAPTKIDQKQPQIEETIEVQSKIENSKSSSESEGIFQKLQQKDNHQQQSNLYQSKYIDSGTIYESRYE